MAACSDNTSLPLVEDTIVISLIRIDADQRMAVAAKARSAQQIKKERYSGPSGKLDGGTIYLNYSRTISNRMLSLYDDCVLLLREERIATGCIVARCILETFAVGHFAHSEVTKAYEAIGVDAAITVALEYVNSSRIKVEEQKRLKNNKFSAKDYYFTKQALGRMQKEEAASKHIMNALRYLFRLEMDRTKQPESQLEFVYEALSEWTHPSQTSLMHAFTPETWDVPTSVGPLSIWDAAISRCSHALFCVAGLPELLKQMEGLANQLAGDGSGPRCSN